MRKRYSIARSLSQGPAEATALVVTSKALSVFSNHIEKAHRVNALMMEAEQAEDAPEPEQPTEAVNDRQAEAEEVTTYHFKHREDEDDEASGHKPTEPEDYVPAFMRKEA